MLLNERGYTHDSNKSAIFFCIFCEVFVVLCGKVKLNHEEHKKHTKGTKRNTAY